MSKCPICGETEFARFVFAFAHVDPEREQCLPENPTDTQWLDACPNWHIRGEDGKVIAPWNDPPELRD